jgi:hypothetical protein
VFAEVNTIKAQARAEGRDIINFGMGTETKAEFRRKPSLPSRNHYADQR